jgi:hypothetical protein
LGDIGQLGVFTTSVAEITLFMTHFTACRSLS